MLSVIINGWAISIATVARLRPRPRPWECVGEHVHLSRAISSDTRVIWRDLRTSRCLVLCIWFRRTLRISSLQVTYFLSNLSVRIWLPWWFRLWCKRCYSFPTWNDTFCDPKIVVLRRGDLFMVKKSSETPYIITDWL